MFLFRPQPHLMNECCFVFLFVWCGMPVVRDSSVLCCMSVRSVSHVVEDDMAAILVKFAPRVSLVALCSARSPTANVGLPSFDFRGFDGTKRLRSHDFSLQRRLHVEQCHTTPHP